MLDEDTEGAADAFVNAKRYDNSKQKFIIQFQDNISTQLYE